MTLMGRTAKKNHLSLFIYTTSKIGLRFLLGPPPEKVEAPYSRRGLDRPESYSKVEYEK
jgi:hypothetical protein